MHVLKIEALQAMWQPTIDSGNALSSFYQGQLETARGFVASLTMEIAKYTNGTGAGIGTGDTFESIATANLAAFKDKSATQFDYLKRIANVRSTATARVSDLQKRHSEVLAQIAYAKKHSRTD